MKHICTITEYGSATIVHRYYSSIYFQFCADESSRKCLNSMNSILVINNVIFHVTKCSLNKLFLYLDQ